MSLTTKRIAKTIAPGRYLDSHGLYLQITSSGVKSWLFRYELHGRERWMGLGPLHTISLQDARNGALKARQQLLEGIDPLETRRTERTAAALAAAKTKTFRECALAYFDLHERKWRNSKHRKQFVSSLDTYAFPIIGKRAVSEIDTPLVLQVLQPIWQGLTETASRVRGRIENVLDWATVQGYRKGDNPARWRGHLSNALPARSRIAKPQHHAALPYRGIPAFMGELRTRLGIAPRALEFTILTAARTGEVIGAKWSEIDLAGRTWTVPSSRMKAGREHRVPLSDRAIAILDGLPREGEYVFPGTTKGSSISNMSMDAVLRRMGYKDGRATVHGFRSTFRDWAAESTGYPNHVVEMALAHVVQSKTEAAYRRGDLFMKRCKLMSDWARYCTNPLHLLGDGKVTELRSA